MRLCINLRYSVYALMLVLSWLGLQESTAPLSSAATPSKHTTPDDTTIRSRVSSVYHKLPLSFEVNQGQTDKQVKFMSRGNNYSLFLTPTQAVLAFSQPSKTDKQVVKPQKQAKGAVLRMEWVGGNRTPQILGLQPLPGKSNYFTSQNPQNWHAKISNYAKVQYRSVYPGIDLVYYGNQKHLEYDWVVAAGADPRQIRLKIAGADRLEVDRRGDLVLHTKTGEIRQHRPRIYQQVNGQKKTVQGHYLLLGKNEVGFAIASYDRSKVLTIDPVLSYSTYLGGSSADIGFSVAVDIRGNTYITGTTFSPDFPVSPSAFDKTFDSNDVARDGDIFVAKLNASGTALLYSTYLGGSKGENGSSIATDLQGSAYVTGATNSTDFPISRRAFDKSLNGSLDAFVTKLSAKGDLLLYSTYLGGRDDSFDQGFGIAVNNLGNAYVTGRTSSPTFPTTPNALSHALNGFSDAYVTKLNYQGSQLLYSSYLGGSGSEDGSDIAVDALGRAYVTGGTSSFDFPTTSGAFDRSFNGGVDVFLTKLNLEQSGSSSLLYSTYLGGSNDDGGDDDAENVALDIRGNAYVIGRTFSSDFPTTSDAFDRNLSGSNDVFVAKLNLSLSSLNSLVYSTYLGGSGDNDFSEGIAVDKKGNAYVVGFTDNADFPTTPDAFDSNLSGIYDGFITQLNVTGDRLLYSTYLGGDSFDQAEDVAVDILGNAYVVGGSESSNFPVTSNTLDETLNGSADAFITKISGEKDR
jgi:Beta-propeller repeat